MIDETIQVNRNELLNLLKETYTEGYGEGFAKGEHAGYLRGKLEEAEKGLERINQRLSITLKD